MKSISFLLVGSALALAAVACGSSDSSDSSTATTATTTATTSSSASTTASTGAGGMTGSTTASTTASTGTATGGAGGGAACSVTGTTDTCANACATLYMCGALTCNGTRLCASDLFNGMAANQMSFVGDDMNGCIMGCNGQPALQGLIDPTDCANTIMTLEAVSSDFNTACTMN